MSVKFPDAFVWGTATASYQIEGAFDTDGRGVSIWDTFSKTPGKVVNGDTGDNACDHYNRFDEDIAIMKDLGVKAYRFSIAWPRLFPQGDSVREERGFDFYNRLINALIAADIEPMVTLYHWDLPQTLEDQGGWANRDIVEKFAHYAQACAQAFGDRINSWITLNEPWCVSWLGNSNGAHAPGKKDFFKPGDAELLKVQTDFLGVNYYSDGFIRSALPEDKPAIEGGFMPFPQRANMAPPASLANSLTAMGWVVTPEGLGNLVKKIHRDWPHIPYIVITENGSSYEDTMVDGQVNDTERTSYLVRHLQSLQSAIAEGAPVKGYFAWSLLDNFEWAEGYNKRFGLVHVDYTTFKRTLKLSGKTYKEIINNNGF